MYVATDYCTDGWYSSMVSENVKFGCKQAQKINQLYTFGVQLYKDREF